MLIYKNIRKSYVAWEQKSLFDSNCRVKFQRPGVIRLSFQTHRKSTYGGSLNRSTAQGISASLKKLEEDTLRSTNIAGWKMDPDWRCISYWKWWCSIASLVYQRISPWCEKKSSQLFETNSPKGLTLVRSKEVSEKASTWSWNPGVGYWGSLWWLIIIPKKTG